MGDTQGLCSVLIHRLPHGSFMECALVPCACSGGAIALTDVGPITWTASRAAIVSNQALYDGGFAYIDNAAPITMSFENKDFGFITGNKALVGSTVVYSLRPCFCLFLTPARLDTRTQEGSGGLLYISHYDSPATLSFRDAHLNSSYARLGKVGSRYAMATCDVLTWS